MVILSSPLLRPHVVPSRRFHPGGNYFPLPATILTPHPSTWYNTLEIYTVMKTLSRKLRSMLRAAFGLFSLTSVAFVMQACYGSPQDVGLSVRLHGTVVDRETQEPIKGIKVSTPFEAYSYSDSLGNVSLFIPEEELLDSLRISCEDVDSTDGGYYNRLDTLLSYQEIEGGHVSFVMDKAK